jgi:hypothetical protein
MVEPPGTALIIIIAQHQEAHPDAQFAVGGEREVFLH